MLWCFKDLWSKEGTVPTMTEILKLRDNEETYKLFMKVFVREVVGARVFDDRIRNGRIDYDELATRTDEAFALLVVENSEACWRDLLERNNGYIPTVKRGATRPDSLKTNIEPKYTKSDEVLGHGMEAARKWNNDGINRFNELLKMVSNDRERHPRFEVRLINEERTLLAEKKRKKKQKPMEPIVLAMNDLGGSDSEEEERGLSSSGEETEDDNSISGDDDDALDDMVGAKIS